MKSLQERIKFVISVTGWSNAELARQAGVSRTAPTDWLRGGVGNLAATTAQRLSSKTSFTATWLATGDGPMYKAAIANGRHQDGSEQEWPFIAINEEKVRKLSPHDMTRLETAVLAFAEKYKLDIAGDEFGPDVKKND